MQWTKIVNLQLGSSKIDLSSFMNKWQSHDLRYFFSFTNQCILVTKIFSNNSVWPEWKNQNFYFKFEPFWGQMNSNYSWSSKMVLFYAKVIHLIRFLFVWISWMGLFYRDSPIEKNQCFQPNFAIFFSALKCEMLSA
jgi:hypothetical protein